MTLLDMQRVLSRILTDKAFQESFIAGDVPRPATYQLTERELRSLRGLRWDRVGLHSELLAHGRLELALKALPLTSQLIHDQLHEHLGRFCAEYPPIPGSASGLYLEASRLCDFAIELISEGVLQPAWAVDMIVYERTLMALTFGEEPAASATRVAELNDEPSLLERGWPPPDLRDLVPVAGPHARVASFSYPLPELIPLLEGGDVPATVVQLELPMLLLFHKVPGGLVRMVKINAPAAALLDACAQDRTVAGVLDLLSRRFGPGIDERAIAALRWLCENGVVGLRKEI